MKRKLLKRNKGFTLVECIVAIGVFAVMSALVMQILALAIRQHGNNNQVEKDIDAQIQAIVNDNGLLNRETTDIAFKFVNVMGATNTFTVNDVTVKQDVANNDMLAGRLELNTFDASISPDASGGNSNNDGSAGMMTSTTHIYGTKGITNVYIRDQSTPPGANSDIYNMSFSVKITDEQSILSKAESNAIKISIPSQARNLVVQVPSTMSYSLLGGGSIRFYDKSTSSRETSYDGIHITFTLDRSNYESYYKSFAKYFISPDSNLTDTSKTFTDAETPGIYNTVR